MPKLVLVVAFFLAGCASSRQPAWPVTPDGRKMESLILWQGDPKSLDSVLADPARFEVQGNFYRVKGEFAVFGYPATYLGLIGIDRLAGPNAVLKASPKEIAASISRQYGCTFENRGGNYRSEIKKHIHVYIVRHPDFQDQSIVIGSSEVP
jgi:hypothetical protein